MALGTPVIAARASSLPEVGGDAAVYVAPDDDAALATEIRRVLDDDAHHAALRAASLAQSARFSWDDTARATLAAFDDAMTLARTEATTVTIVLAISTLLLLAATIVLGVQQLRQRAVRKQRDLFGEWPIRRVPPEAVDPVLKPGPLGPTTETEVAFIGRGPYVVDGGTSDAEAWILAVLARRARRMFEFGTCTGKTAYLWARNSAAGRTRRRRVTLAPDHLDRLPRGGERRRRRTCSSRCASRRTPTFLYTGTAVADKVEQLFARQQDARRLAVGGTVRPRVRGRLARVLVRRERQREGARARRAGRPRAVARLRRPASRAAACTARSTSSRSASRSCASRGRRSSPTAKPA